MIGHHALFADVAAVLNAEQCRHDATRWTQAHVAVGAPGRSIRRQSAQAQSYSLAEASQGHCARETESGERWLQRQPRRRRGSL